MKTPSLKQLQIDKASQKMIIYASIASFLLVFTLFSSRALISRMNFQNKVIDKKSVALDQLKKDSANSSQLSSAYQEFISPSKNLLGASSLGTGPNEGNNAKLVLDALPSEYDFPALATSLQSLLTSGGVNVDSISGTDKTSASSGSSASGAQTSITAADPIPFQFSVDGPEKNIILVTTDFEKSIRPFQFGKMTITASNSGNLNLSVNANTFYLPAQKFTISKEKIK